MHSHPVKESFVEYYKSHQPASTHLGHGLEAAKSDDLEMT